MAQLVDEHFVVKLSNNNADFYLLQNKGDFLLLLRNSFSRYSGWFIKKNFNMIKVLDHIKINRDRTYKDFERGSNFIKIIHDDFWEKYTLYNDILLYETSKPSLIRPSFDIRYIFDLREWGRNYSILLSLNRVKISFSRDDLSLAVYINGFSEARVVDEWREMFYDFDKNRNSPPWKWWIYYPIELYGKKFVFTINRKIYRLQKEKKKKFRIYKPENIILDAISYKIAKNTLSSFAGEWISAGYPWFFEEWTRDVLIALPGFYKIGRKDIVRDVLVRYKDLIKENGKMKNKIRDERCNIDSIGWYADRFYRFNRLLREDDRREVIKSLIRAEKGLRSQIKDSLLYSYPGETWMDSIPREGFNLEVQALLLRLYDTLYRETEDTRYLDALLEAKEKVRLAFLREDSLIDNPSDPAIRPNVFLAYYIYPQMIDRKTWIRVFENSISKLWLGWGGFSSIDKSDPRFLHYHTGEDPKSYHNGDSWIFLNNIAAISMIDLNKDLFKPYWTKIYSRAREWVVKNGTLHEVSPAKEPKPAGALSQLWSIATYIELYKAVV